MNTLIVGSFAIAVYASAFLFHCFQLRKHPQFPTALLQMAAAAGIVLHAATTVQLLFTPQGMDLSISRILALLSLAINLLVFISSLRKPLHNLYLLLFPASAVFLLLAITGETTRPISHPAYAIEAHILLSVLAYSLLTIAALQALLLAYQDWHLRHKHQSPLMRAFPPLQTMEALLFELIWAGELLLSLSLLSGFLFYENFFAQHLLHKVAFSSIAWIFYAVLLWGRHQRGWRGATAIRLTWAGFVAIVLGYLGSKFVLEILLG